MPTAPLGSTIRSVVSRSVTMAAAICSFGDRHDPLHQPMVDGEGVGTGAGHGQPVCHGGRLFDGDGPTGLERSTGVVTECRLDTDHPALRRQLGHGRRTTGHQPTAAHRHQQQIEIADLLVELQRRGALTQHDVAVLEGVDEGRPGGPDPFQGRRLSIGDRAIEGDHLGACGFDEPPLGGRSVPGNEHHGRHGQHLGRGRHRRPVVSRRHRNHPGRPLRGRDLGEPMEGPPELEGAGPLHALDLAQHRCPHQLVEFIAGDHRRANGSIGDHLGRGPEIGQCQRLHDTHHDSARLVEATKPSDSNLDRPSFGVAGNVRHRCMMSESP